MALTSDQRDILEVFLIVNLANITQNSPFVLAPVGFQNFINTITIDNVANLNFPSDFRELLVNYILTQQNQGRTRIRQRRSSAFATNRLTL